MVISTSLPVRNASCGHQNGRSDVAQRYYSDFQRPVVIVCQQTNKMRFP